MLRAGIRHSSYRAVSCTPSPRSPFIIIIHHGPGDSFRASGTKMGQFGRSASQAETRSSKLLGKMVSRVGIEPTTTALKVLTGPPTIRRIRPQFADFGLKRQIVFPQSAAVFYPFLSSVGQKWDSVFDATGGGKSDRIVAPAQLISFSTTPWKTQQPGRRGDVRGWPRQGGPGRMARPGSKVEVTAR